MELLDSVNTCLTALGEARVTSTDTRHPSVDLILQTLATKQKLMLERGFWFNTQDEEMFPDLLGLIPYPATSIAVESLDGYTIYSKRNNWLFDNTHNTMYFTGPVCIRVTYNLDFEDLPESVATVITYRAARAVYVGDLGNDASVQDLVLNEQQAMLLVEEQHMRNKKHSTRRRRPWGKYQNALSG
ncbi:putative tubular protein A [Pectobacterium phage PP90]|uniref:Putative tubular protein A n=2 Tax=Phimunavirus TaxID=2560202 RepID=A0A2U7N668_9CAUD|nr:tail protein [Pectobacterium phage PP90]YP_009625558.1 tail protein [Pectobacterium phage vB_PatP_CB5]ANT45401.1 putative tubular protein A [Pectobacterium phage PP90]ARW59019.1 putative tubular protein A [Pectobacterium phage vB_PatP_CB5]